MIVEQAIFPIKPGQAKAFEAAFAQARRFIQASPGFQKLEMRPCIEVADRYLLVVWWDSVDAHMQGFRESEAFKQWRALLGPHFAGPPEVHHYAAGL